MNINRSNRIRLSLLFLVVLSASFLLLRPKNGEKGLALNLFSSAGFNAESYDILHIGLLPEKEVPLSDPFRSNHGRIVRIRGFWYPLEFDSRGCGVLTSRPDLKSCCIGASLKITEQIIVKGERIDASVGRALTLTGVFKIDPRYNEEGNLVQLYVLDRSEDLQL